MGLLKELPLTERPREKAFLFGMETLTNSELIAVLLGTGSKDKDVLELAHSLLKSCGSLINLSLMSLQELCEVNGIKTAKAIKIKAAIEFHNRLEKEKILNSTIIKDVHQGAIILKNHFRDNNREEFAVLLLDKNDHLIGIKTLSIGSISAVIISPNILLTKIIKSNAKSFLIAHNHPSNSCNASEYDVENTSNLRMISSLIGVTMLDHIIITDNHYFSITTEKIYQF